MLYRYQVFVLKNVGTDISQLNDTDVEVTVFGEYAAQIPFLIICIQIGVFAILTVIFLFTCKAIPKKDFVDVQPEKDEDYETPGEVGEEEERIAKLLNDNPNNEEIIVVHKLVKRYKGS